MPPNRKTSLIHSRFVTLQAVTTKDAPSSRPVIDASYWDWPTESEQPVEVPPQTNHHQKKDLFSANHIVANLVREASRMEQQQEEEEKQEDVCSNDDSYEYWNPHRDQTTTVIENRYTSGLAMESNLIRDAQLVFSNQQEQEQPSIASRNPVNDALWYWPTFPHAAMRFSHDHYQRQLVVTAEESLQRSLSNSSTILITNSSTADDYWCGM